MTGPTSPTHPSLTWPWARGDRFAYPPPARPVIEFATKGLSGWRQRRTP
jgi:hypothetical protein